MRSRYRDLLRVCAVLISVALPINADAAVIFLQDFESGLGASETTGGTFTISAGNTAISVNGSLQMGHPANYGNFAYDYYEVALDLTGVQNAMMSFDWNAQIEFGFDRFNVLASAGAIAPPAGLLVPSSGMSYRTTSSSLQPFLGATFYDSSGLTGGRMGTATFDLSPFDGGTVNVRFQFGSDGSVTFPGFGMDNLLVTGDVPEPSTFFLLGTGLLGLVAYVRRR